MLREDRPLLETIEIERNRFHAEVRSRIWGAIMPWGVFSVDDDAGRKVAVHVVPCNKDNGIEAPHMLDNSCPCQPRLEFQPGGVPLFIHERAH